MSNLYIAFAPLQGYTDCVYRRAHHECVGGVDEYYTPFVRLEGGAPRAKDLRDIDPERNAGMPTVPQVIAKDGDEFARLCDTLQELGWTRIDLNMGCPFPMQVKAGRGSGLLQHPERVEEIAREMQRRPEVQLSVKMRLGQESAEESMTLLPILNDMPLVHVTMHPRLGKQQYKGPVDIDAFERFMEGCKHPMVYNGDITEIKNEELKIKNCADAVTLPTNLKGVMIGRGLLARPWMTYSYALSGTSPDSGEEQIKLEVIKQMHERIYHYAVENLCGDSQILSRLHAFWEYPGSLLNKKQYKAIKKATTLRGYNEAVTVLNL